MGWKTGLAIAIAAAASGAHAQDAGGKHDLCAERPGITINECVIEPGHVQLETALADWTLDKQAGTRDDTVLFGQSLARIGLGGDWELRLGWTPYGIDREREDGEVSHARGIGDVTIGLKRNLVDAQKHGDRGLSLALVPFATLPAGHAGIGAGTWGAGLLAPVGYRVSKLLKFELTPEVDARPDDDGDGRHLRYSAAAGAKFDITDAISIEAEAEALRDDDPDRSKRGTQALAAGSLAWQDADGRLQLDLGGIAGLDHAAPDVELYAGVTRWF